MKTDYLVNENLDLDGVQVNAHYADGSEEVLEPSDYLVTGFDSSEVGTNTITFSYQNQTATLDLTVQALAVNDLRISYLPARLSNFIGDSFVADGLVVEASYNNGEVVRLNTEQYEVEVPEIFETAGTHTLTIQSTETPEQTTALTVEVREAAIEKVHVSQEPQTIQYFIGNTLDLTGLVVYAEYTDGSRVRLLSDDYIVSELDTSSAGHKELIISYKGQEAVVNVNVKEVEGLVVTNYPKTTYTVGEPFSPEGLVIAKEFDNGDLEIINEEDFELDVPAFNEAGTKTILISLNDESLDPIELTVSVVEAEVYEFKDIIFGQSISSSRNFIEETEDGRITLTALEGGGKVTGDHDGISFYYTELDAIEDNFELRATIEVEDYAKNPHDGQESFGIMARDAINIHLDSSVFSSNIAAVGGYSGGTRNPNGTQLFTRTGVLAPDGEGSEGITSKMLEQIDRDGSISRNASGVEITDENFESLDFENFEGFERDENGAIIWGPFLNFISPVEENDDEGTPGNEEEQDSVELTIDTLRAGDSVITGNGPSGVTVYAWTGKTLLGLTTINSPFETTLTEPLIEGMEVVIYGVDADGNQTEPMTFTVEAIESGDEDSEEGDSEELPEEQVEETDQDLESEEESEDLESSERDETKIKLPQTATATGLIGMLGISTLLIGSVLKQFGKKKNNN